MLRRLCTFDTSLKRGERERCVLTLGLATDRVEQAKTLYHDERSAAKAEAPAKVLNNEVTSDTSLGNKHARGKRMDVPSTPDSSRRTVLRCDGVVITELTSGTGLLQKHLSPRRATPWR